ncbi:F-box domain-containing protein [Caenorhabditis elegans]|uniref:F-box domain-containing protein n=1 Tax=Caenorhabditis elegans TaxID=6239 RepID=Q9U3N0_CAEEL|nr:F-box domain-containing protein [Caenorhabditis elegans]CAB63438.2 F-box domain-containing protein [Caenorhabditis elegans]|eukprot:NP_507445.2 F-box A protein [Caenorhabditis elegans]
MGKNKRTKKLAMDSGNSGTISKPSSIVHLPIDVLEEFLEKLEPKDRFLLRKVSRQFKALIDNRDYGLKRIKLSINIMFKSCSIYFDENRVEYEDIPKLPRGTPRKWENPVLKDDCSVCLEDDVIHRVVGMTHLEVALSDMTLFLRNSKCRLDWLSVPRAFNQSSETITRLFSDQLTNLHVKKLILREFTSTQIAQILPSFKAGVLEEILWELHDPVNIDVVQEDLVGLEQWKRAKSLIVKPSYFKKSYVHVTTDFQLFANFSKLKAYLKFFREDHARDLKEILPKIPNFKSWTLTAPIEDPMEVVKIFRPEYAGGPFRSIDYTAHGLIYTIEFDFKHFKVIGK